MFHIWDPPRRNLPKIRLRSFLQNGFYFAGSYFRVVNPSFVSHDNIFDKFCYVPFERICCLFQ